MVQFPLTGSMTDPESVLTDPLTKVRFQRKYLSLLSPARKDVDEEPLLVV